MADLAGPRNGQQFWLTRGHLAALGLTTVSIAVLAFFVGVQVGKAQVEAPAEVQTASFLPDPDRQDALEELLREVERVQEPKTGPEDLGFVEALREGKADAPPEDQAPADNVAAVDPGVEDAPEAPAPPPAEAVVPTSGWAVQIASFATASEADELVARLIGQEHAAYRVEALVRGQTWYRVRIGGFSNQDAATQGMADLGRALGRTDLMVSPAP